MLIMANILGWIYAHWKWAVGVIVGIILLVVLFSVSMRILKPAVTLAGKESTHKGTCAVFLDPPYSAEAGRSSVYTVEDFSVAHAVRDWCIEETDNENIRIALAGYDVEHAILEKEYGWEAFSWSANGGYSSFADKGNASHANKKREVIWFSPSCSSARGELFNGL